MDLRYVGKPNRYIYTNSILGDAGFTNSVQRGDFQGANGTSWTTHVSRSISKPNHGCCMYGSCFEEATSYVY